MSSRQTLWFIVPAHGRHNLTAICLRQLRRTCTRLIGEGIEATAVVIADDENLDTARALEFGTIERDNRFLSRKFNDGIQLALDPNVNPRPADYVVPCGSDDWVHHTLFRVLPSSNAMVGFQHMSFVREDGRELSARKISYPGGCGIRVYPRQVMAALRYRPADEDRSKGCDTSILYNLQRALPTLRIIHHAHEPWTIVDWKSPDTQVTAYSEVGRHPVMFRDDPYDALRDHYPDDALEEIHAHYTHRLVTA